MLKSLVGVDKAFYFCVSEQKGKERQEKTVTYLLRGATCAMNGEKNPVIIGEKPTEIQILDMEGCIALPAFCDVHVHFREPGFSYKETMKSGMAAAAHGGYTDVCTMPNVSPAPDTKEHIAEQLKCMGQNPKIRVMPYGTITVERAGTVLADMEDMKDSAIAFSDDGSGIQEESLMLAAMEKAKSLGKIICAHCEDNALLKGGYIHDGEYAKKNGHRGICSESEFGQIARDIELVRKTGCAYHVCHISTKESVELIRKAKAEGLDVTCETGPHYLVLSDKDLQEDGRFKMNPPLRSEEDKQALIEGVLDGTNDMIATDHAPHSAEEKGKGLEKSAMGVVGLETAFAVMYTHFVKTGILTMEKLVKLMSINPRKRFGIEMHAGDVAVFDVNTAYTIDPKHFKSMGKSSPFTGMQVFGRCVATFCNGKMVWREQD